MNRKSFIGKALTGWAAACSLPVLYGLSRYLFPGKAADPAPVEITAGKLSGFRPDTVTLVKAGQHSFFLTASGEGSLSAFSARCSHLGCVVEYLESDLRFRCNCHGSLFDRDGTNLTGPAARPLAPYRVEVRDGEVIVTAF